ncbi:MAG: hypothetical protein C4331_15270 [Meiothermus sp.]
MRRVLTALCLAGLGWGLAAPSGPHVPTLSEAKELLAAVCPGSSGIGKDGGYCKTCPSFVEAGGDEQFALQSVVYGTFLDPRRTYAVLDFDGCEAHVNNFGGSVILRWKGLTDWELVRYEPGSRTFDCQKITASDRHDLLLCRVGWMGQGYVIDALSLLDLRGKAHWDQVLVLNANTGTCDKNLYQLEITSWGLRPPRLLVQAKAAQWQREGKNCEETPPPKNSVKLHRLEYRFDGRRFVPTPQTAKVARGLEAIGR